MHGNDNGEEKGRQAAEGSFFLMLSYDEWAKIEPKELSKVDKKLKLKKGLTDMLSEKFSIVIPGCVLSFKYHMLPRVTSPKEIISIQKRHVSMKDAEFSNLVFGKSQK